MRPGGSPGPANIIISFGFYSPHPKCGVLVFVAQVCSFFSFFSSSFSSSFPPSLPHTDDDDDDGSLSLTLVSQNT